MTKARDLANASTALSAVSATELGYLDGVTSAVQTQLDAKLASSTAATTYVANSLADAKGDIFVASADNTVTRLPVGSTGDTIVADSSTATGLRYSAIPGANLLANGSFDIWQRGTSGFTSNQAYSADRWFTFSSTTYNIAQETSVVPTGATNSLRVTITGAGGYANLQYAMEQSEVEKLAGQTVTFSVYLRANATYAGGSFNMSIQSNTTGNTQTGGTWTTVSGASTTHTPSTSAFTRVSVTGTVPTNAKGLAFYIGQNVGLGSGSVYYLALAKVEIGSVPTTWSRTAGTIQGELAACQRYFQTLQWIPAVKAIATTDVQTSVQLSPMRTSPTAAVIGVLTITNDTTADYTQSSGNVVLQQFNANGIRFKMGNFTGLTSGNVYSFYNASTTTNAIQLSAEL